LSEYCSLHQYSDGGLKFYEVEKETGCWIWQLAVTYDGYPYYRKFHCRPHRWFYKQLIEPLDDDLELHHDECKNIICVNPFHCKPLTSQEHHKEHPIHEVIYTKTTRHEASKKMWARRSPEKRRQAGLAIASALLGVDVSNTPEGHKYCSGCCSFKPETDFYFRKSVGRHATPCKKCQSDRHKARQLNV
jgi:hypothetical protein